MSLNQQNSKRTIHIVNSGLAGRYRRERRFQRYGLAAISASLVFLCVLLVTIGKNGYSAFRQTFIKLDIHFAPDMVAKEDLASADYPGLVKSALEKMFPDVVERSERRMLNGLVSSAAGFQLQKAVRRDPALIGRTVSMWFPANDYVDMLMKGHFQRSAPEEDRPVNNLQLGWLDRLAREGRIELRFNKAFFTSGDSREPELAGIWGAACGSFYTLLVTLLLVLSPSVCPPLSIWRSSPPETDGPISSK